MLISVSYMCVIAPAVVLEPHGILKDKEATCYPAPKFEHSLHLINKEANVVHSEHVITSRGPATAMEFALKLLEVVTNRDKAVQVASDMLYNYY